MSLGERVLRRFYERAGDDPSRLPWEGVEPSALLRRAAAGLPEGARALDLGCGAGPVSVWLAQRGLAVTGVDLFEEAVRMGRARAREAGVGVTFVAQDLLTFDAEPFDLVHDRGCLHSLVRGDALAYRERVRTLLKPGGELVLEHWLRPSAFDWRPIGPRRRAAAEVVALLGAELVLVERRTERFWARPPHGPRVTSGHFRFVRPSSGTNARSLIR